MALFDKLRVKGFMENKWGKNESLTKKQNIYSQDALSADEKQSFVNDRQELLAQLTPREKDLYLLLLEGFTLKESAKQLGVKYSTANTHMTGIYRKLEVKSRAELIINYRLIKGEEYDE
ncbi:MAG: helix-turn-helix transcriptional regulator [Tissierellia bacterium]|nr:helix-turn-helix transcriptional regulator [Tissierellia bacterium]